MKKTYIKYAIFLLVVIGLYNFLFASMDVHYKLTINVETPEGLKSGSAVREVTNSSSRYDLIDWPGGGNPADIRGEAVIVDLGERGILFGLIESNSEKELYYSFGEGTGASTYQGLKYFNSLDVGDKRVLPKHYWPQMVTFTDMDDPKTVTSVLNKAYCQSKEFEEGKCSVKNANYFVDNTDDLFGEGVNIQSITVEVTDEDVNTGQIKSILKWLDQFYNKRLDGNRFGTVKSNYPTANQFSAGNFSTFREGK